MVTLSFDICMLLSMINKASWDVRFLKKKYLLLCGFPKSRLQHFAVRRPDYNGCLKWHLQFFLVTFFTPPVCGQKAFHQHKTLYYPAFWVHWMDWLTFWLVFEILTDLPKAIFSLDIDYIVIIAICFTNSIFDKSLSLSTLYQEFITTP